MVALNAAAPRLAPAGGFGKRDGHASPVYDSSSVGSAHKFFAFDSSTSLPSFRLSFRHSLTYCRLTRSASSIQSSIV